MIMEKFDINKVYNAYIGLNKRQQKNLIKQLNSFNIPITKIEAFTYREAPGIKHLFFYLKGNTQPVSYFLLTERQLEQIQGLILSY